LTKYQDGELKSTPANDATKAEACYYCHGTKLEVSGSETRDTESAGELEFPIIKGWPNQGVGRINPDGSLGACSPCHTRHAFSIEMARKPYTCKECHVGPDVPAFKVYAASKHGNIFATEHAAWDFKAVPWTIGKDFTAPTCATCHISLLVNTDESRTDPPDEQPAALAHTGIDLCPSASRPAEYRHYPQQRRVAAADRFCRRPG
ncbi:MAG: multiheme c-type cytochrome, partial [Desulfobacterales bacterium]